MGDRGSAMNSKCGTGIKAAMFPTELVLVVLKILGRRDAVREICRSRAVCLEWRDQASDDLLWRTIWREKFASCCVPPHPLSARDVESTDSLPETIATFTAFCIGVLIAAILPTKR